ncbi:hypothetical protein FQZ97_1244110 [compost metagenome]
MLFQRLGNPFSTRCRGRRTDDHCTLPAQLQGDGLTNTAARTGDQSNLTLQAHKTSPKSGQGRTCGGEGIRGIQIVGIDAFDAAFVQP